MRNAELGTRSAEQYSAQIASMTKRAKVWFLKHQPGFAHVQFNFPPDTAAVMPISRAVELRLVIANADGLALIRSLWDAKKDPEPTVSMVRGVIEGVFPKGGNA